MNRYLEIILKEASAVLAKINERETLRFIGELHSAKRIYIIGVGRSGLMVKAFGQRLMHLGLEVHLADEITAPAIARGDLLVACSGTGQTLLPLYMARKARKIGARVASLTSSPRSALARHSNLTLTIPAPLERRQKQHGMKSLQPARSLFEQALILYLDSVVPMLMEEFKITARKIERRHANLE